MDLQEVVGQLRLDLLPEDWVRSVWADDFSTPTELPAEYELQAEDADYAESMNELGIAIKSWLNNDTAYEDRNGSFEEGGRKSLNSSFTSKKSWQSLLPTIDHKALLCFISTFLRQDARSLKGLPSMLEALSATRLYLALLNINGAHVYKVFNTVLYSQALETLKVGNVLCSGVSKPQVKSSGGRKRVNRNAEQDMCDDEESVEDENVELTQSDKRQLVDLLCLAVEDLQCCLKVFQMKDEKDSLILTIQTLVVLTRFERTTSQFLNHCPQPGSVTYLAYKAYGLLMELCVANHGQLEETIRLIMISLLPVFCHSDQPVLRISEKELSVVRDHSTRFVHKISNKYPKHCFVGVKSLLQQLCVRVPDKADIRMKFVLNILDLLNQLPQKVAASFITWVISFCHTDKVRHRITGIELLSKLLSLEERPWECVSSVYESGDSLDHDDSDGQQKGNEIDFSSHSFLFAAILSRCTDISSTVRAKALSALVSVTSKNVYCRHMVESIFITNYCHVQVIEPTPDDKEIVDFKAQYSKKSNRNGVNIDPLPSGTVIVQLLEKLVEDDKVFVRKNALHALCNIFSLNIKWATEKRLSLLVSSCKDASVLVRKLLTQCMTDLLLEYPTHSVLPKCWVRGIIPLIGDNEIRSQEKVLEAIENVILNNMIHYNEKGDVLSILPWKILTLISSLGMRQLFRFACKQWTVKNRIKRQLFNIIESHIGTENNLAAWFLLVCLSEFQNIPNPKFVLDYYYANIHDATIVDEYWSQLVLEAVRLNWMELDEDLQEELCLKLKERIESFSILLPLIARSIEICQLYDSANINTWGESLIHACESYLTKTIAPGCNKKVANEQVLSQYVFTLGEVTQFCPGIIQKSTIGLLAKLVDPDYDDEGSEKWEGTVDDCVQAVIISTLGKIALQDQFIAKSLVPSFGNLLTTQLQSSVKINAIVALSDLCIKFTGLIEFYLGDMFVCLRDSNLIVRTNTLTLLMQLIQEDYLKLRCPFFFYILFMLEDETMSIREQTSAFMVNTVLSKNPSIMYQHFIQAVFFYNDFEEHASYNKVAMSPQEKAAFCIPGESNRERRQKLYRYMLDHMQDDHRFKVTYRLCTEILGEVCEGKIQLDEVGTFVLRDALYVLACEEIRMIHNRSGKDAQDDDNGEMMEEVITHVRNSIISQLIKKNYVEYILPIIVRLRNKLKEMKSPLVRDVMVCIRGLMKDFKEELNEILGDDPELAAEVAHDLRLMEEEEGEAARDEEEAARDEEYQERHQQITTLMKEARIKCVCLPEEVLLTGSVNLGSPPQGLEFNLATLTPITASPRSTVAANSNSNNPPPSSSSRNSPRNNTPLNSSSSSASSSSSRRKRNRRSRSQKS